MLLAHMTFNRQRFHRVGMARLQNHINYAIDLIFFHHLAEHFQALIVRRNTGAANRQIFIRQRVVDIARFCHALLGRFRPGAVFITDNPAAILFNRAHHFFCCAANRAAGD